MAGDGASGTPPPPRAKAPAEAGSLEGPSLAKALVSDPETAQEGRKTPGSTPRCGQRRR